MNEIRSEIKLVKSKIFNRYWLENGSGVRLTPKFSSYEETKEEDFVVLNTNKGAFVYNKNKDGLLFSDMSEKANACIYRVTNKTYLLRVKSFVYSYVELCTWNGVMLYYPELDDVFPIGNGFIAVESYLGEWGIINEDLNWIVQPRYDDILPFNNSRYAIGQLKDKFDIIKLQEKTDEIEIVTFNGYYVENLTEELLLVTSNKKYGVTATSGEIILPMEYDSITLKDNYFIIKQDGLYGLATKAGRILHDCLFYKINYTDGKFIATSRKVIETTEELTV